MTEGIDEEDAEEGAEGEEQAQDAIEAPPSELDEPHHSTTNQRSVFGRKVAAKMSIFHDNLVRVSELNEQGLIAG